MSSTKVSDLRNCLLESVSQQIMATELRHDPKIGKIECSNLNEAPFVHSPAFPRSPRLSHLETVHHGRGFEVNPCTGSQDPVLAVH